MDNNCCHILVNLSTRLLYLFQGDCLLKKYPVGIGKSSSSTPTGKYFIAEKVFNPSHAAFGTRNLLLSNSKCIHGTNDPSSIGGLVSGG